MNFKRTIKYLRSALLRPYYLLHHNHIDTTTYVRKASGLVYCRIGKYCWINKGVGMNHVEMGNYCSVAGGVSIGGMEHPVSHISTSTQLSDAGYSHRVTHIGHDAWIGAQTYIRQGVTIGNGAVIGAKSFVNKDVPPYAIVVGIPAKVLRVRFSDEIIAELNETHYWDFTPQEAKAIIARIEEKYNII